MTVLRAFLDTCVLFKPILCDTLLSVAEDEAFRPLWSHDVLGDFPAESLRTHAIEVAHQDEFLEELLDLQPNIILNALARQASRYRRDPRTVEDLLITLGSRGNGCPGFAKSCHAFRV